MSACSRRSSRARSGVRGFEATEATRPWMESAVGILESAWEAFEALVHREDIEELEAHGALAELRGARRGLDRAFEDVLAALDIELGELRLSRQEGSQQVQTELAHFLNNYHGGEFESLRTRQAMEVAEQARAHLEQLDGPQAVRARVERALESVRAAREVAAGEGAEAVSAYTELVEGRSLARVCYLTGRDLVSAALRFDGVHDELDELIPPIADVVAGQRGVEIHGVPMG